MRLCCGGPDAEGDDARLSDCGKDVPPPPPQSSPQQSSPLDSLCVVTVAVAVAVDDDGVDAVVETDDAVIPLPGTGSQIVAAAASSSSTPLAAAGTTDFVFFRVFRNKDLGGDGGTATGSIDDDTSACDTTTTRTLSKSSL